MVGLWKFSMGLTEFSWVFLGLEKEAARFWLGCSSFFSNGSLLLYGFQVVFS